MQYAAALRSGNRQSVVSDTGFKMDLSAIRAETKKPVLIVFDEGDVSSNSNVLLEKIRNIFMNLIGYMLVLSGTPTLFPLIDEVFSPIVRQFKKITVEPFQQFDETEECIRRPLESIGVYDPSQLFDTETFRDVEEIHRLSGGRPYEIQLICHFLFRKVQEGRSRRMELSVDVLDDVLRELGSTQDVSARPVIGKVRNLKADALKALAILCVSEGDGTFEQIWGYEYLLHGSSRIKKEDLREFLTEFERLGIMSCEDEKLRFAGDDFDRIYCKYYARKNDVYLSIAQMPYELVLPFGFNSQLTRRCRDLEVLRCDIGKIEPLDLDRVMAAFFAAETEQDVFESYSRAAETLYWPCIKYRNEEGFRIMSALVTTPWVSFLSTFMPKEKTHSDQCRKALAESIEEIAQRGKEVGIDVKFAEQEIAVVPLETLLQKLGKSGNKSLREEIAGQHHLKMVDAYQREESLEEAAFHGELSFRLAPKWATLNNLGYLYLASGKLELARQWLTRSLELCESDSDKALPAYNLGIIEAKDQNYERALEKFETAMRFVKDAARRDRKMACLLAVWANLEKGTCDFCEVKFPDLFKTAEQAAVEMRELIGYNSGVPPVTGDVRTDG